MSPDISEFSYGFALVDELIHWHGWPLRASPVYPSLRQEARVGYDVHLLRSSGIPVFLQFKLADRMVRRSAKEVRAGHFTPPFYRMHLRPSSHSRQHQLLLALEAAGQEVFYVAPTFDLPSQLNDAYLHHQVRQRSRFFRPSSIGALPTAGRHHVAFTGAGNFLLCSQPQSKTGAMDGRGFEEEMSAKVREKGRDALSPAALDRLCASMMDALPEILDESDAQGPGVRDPERPAERAWPSRLPRTHILRLHDAGGSQEAKPVPKASAMRLPAKRLPIALLRSSGKRLRLKNELPRGQMSTRHRTTP